MPKRISGNEKKRENVNNSALLSRSQGPVGFFSHFYIDIVKDVDEWCASS